MLLAVDIGNSNIVVGVFDGEHLIADFRLRTDERATGDELGLAVSGLLQDRGVDRAVITAVVVSSVVPGLSRPIEEFSQRCFGCLPLLVGPGIRTGIRILIDDPRQVGADRIVNALGTFRSHGGPAIIVDFGTATTFDAINEHGDYLGGAIAPGMEISLEALVHRAARLSRVDLVAPPAVIGRNTAWSMQAGLVFGYVGLVEGLVRRMKDELGGDPKVVATGGAAEVLARLTDTIDVVDQQLTLLGLRIVHELNAER